ncbi:MAG: potassium transporter TrkG, partial [bacterium]
MFANAYGKAGSNNFLRFLFRSPSRVSIFAFILLIAIGTILLMLPAASKAGALPFIDALFTATSASCVTGLTVVDTGRRFSFFGQVVILFLVQAGGLGIMTLSTLFILVAGRRISMAGKIVIQDTFTYNKEQGVYSVVKEVIL